MPSVILWREKKGRTGWINGNAMTCHREASSSNLDWNTQLFWQILREFPFSWEMPVVPRDCGLLPSSCQIVIHSFSRCTIDTMCHLPVLYARLFYVFLLQYPLPIYTTSLFALILTLWLAALLTHYFWWCTPSFWGTQLWCKTKGWVCFVANVASWNKLHKNRRKGPPGRVFKGKKTLSSATMIVTFLGGLHTLRGEDEISITGNTSTRHM